MIDERQNTCVYRQEFCYYNRTNRNRSVQEDEEEGKWRNCLHLIFSRRLFLLSLSEYDFDLIRFYLYEQGYQKF